MKGRCTRNKRFRKQAINSKEMEIDHRTSSSNQPALKHTISCLIFNDNAWWLKWIFNIWAFDWNAHVATYIENGLTPAILFSSKRKHMIHVLSLNIVSVHYSWHLIFLLSLTQCARMCNDQQFTSSKTIAQKFRKWTKHKPKQVNFRNSKNVLFNEKWQSNKWHGSNRILLSPAIISI